MSLISMEFLTFVAVAVIGYYLIPKRYQWVWLLAFSYIYYASSGMKYLVFLLYTTVVTYGTARMIYGADQKFAKQKEKIKTYKKSIMLLALILDFGMLAVLKYTNFAIANINTLFHAVAFIVLGVLSGALGSAVSITKYLKEKEFAIVDEE